MNDLTDYSVNSVYIEVKYINCCEVQQTLSVWMPSGERMMGRMWR